MNRGIKSVLVMLLIISAVHSNAQTITQTIRGTVLDAESQISLPGATVIILDSDPIIGTTTDMMGNFSIEKVPLGRYNIQASFIGYMPYIMKEVQIGSSKEAVLNFLLEFLHLHSQFVNSVNEIVAHIYQLFFVQLSK